MAGTSPNSPDEYRWPEPCWCHGSLVSAHAREPILHTFGDAVKELGDDSGLRVHRSWWVSRRALADGELESTKRLRLTSGVEIPVSRTFRAQLLQAAHAETGNQHRV